MTRLFIAGAGAFNFIPGEGPVVGDEIVSHPHLAAVGFIGSTVVIGPR